DAAFDMEAHEVEAGRQHRARLVDKPGEFLQRCRGTFRDAGVEQDDLAAAFSEKTPGRGLVEPPFIDTLPPGFQPAGGNKIGAFLYVPVDGKIADKQAETVVQTVNFGVKQVLGRGVEP